MKDHQMINQIKEDIKAHDTTIIYYPGLMLNEAENK
jgi:hypothetical protein